jgi:hypothetical protein
MADITARPAVPSEAETETEVPTSAATLKIVLKPEARNWLSRLPAALKTRVSRHQAPESTS